MPAEDEAEPNLPQEPKSSKGLEFDQWYAEAIHQGFVLDFPKNHLSIVMGEIQVKVRNASAVSGYTNMGWREAEAMMKKQNCNV